MAPVDLAPFWAAWDQLQQEHARLPDYTAAAEFWASYDAKLRGSSALLSQARKDMELNTQWSSPGNANAASTAFYGRLDAGAGSIQRWLDSDTAGAMRELATLVTQLDAHFRAVDEHRNWLLTQDKVVGSIPVRFGSVATLRKISDQDRGTVQVEQKTAAEIAATVRDAVRLRDELTRQFEKARLKLEALPHDQKWLGPTTVAAPMTPGQIPLAGAPGGAPSPTGPNANAPGSANAPGGPTAPGTDKPGAPTGPASNASAPSMSPPGPGSDKTGGPAPGDTDLGTPLPTNEPVLAGTPSPTMTPLPGVDQGGPRIPSAVPGMPTGNPNLGVPLSTPFMPIGGDRDALSSFTPAGSPATPTSAGRATPRVGADPLPPARSTPLGAAPGIGASEGAPALSRGAVPPGPGTSTGSGFYPPMMPPMYPSSGGGGGGVRPGEADHAGGPALRAGGRDSWRAGLRPQLRGRAGGSRDDDEARELMSGTSHPPRGGEVLDEELWQVPDAAPPMPSEPRPERRRSRGF
jgi:hypothetical protein